LFTWLIGIAFVATSLHHKQLNQLATIDG